MSTTSAARSAAYSDRRTTASNSTRPRPPPGRADAKQRPNSQDGPPHASMADADLPNGSAAGSNRRKGVTSYPTERRTEKTQITMKENIQIRRRSPSKQPTTDSGGSGRSWDREKVRPTSLVGAGSSAEERKEHESSQCLSIVALLCN